VRIQSGRRLFHRRLSIDLLIGCGGRSLERLYFEACLRGGCEGSDDLIINCRNV
jgi:hypothetical protein